MSSNTIIFKDERILPGTAWIGELPIDISCKSDHIVLNSVGAFSGDWNKMSKSECRGKGLFRQMIPAVKQALPEFGYQSELYLTPLSPVWKKHYNLVEVSNGWKVIL